jgi:hypothetical protein
MNIDYLKNGLLRYNYFPYQKEKKEEVPPCFNSTMFSPQIAAEIQALIFQNREMGFDTLDFHATRFNNVPRTISIPHPKPYSDLVGCISSYWQNISYIVDNSNSLIKPKIHPDGRIIIMDYEMNTEKTTRFISNGFGKRFVVYADISNCYPSIYSHSLAWALVGFEYSKSHLGRTEWFNRVDKKYMVSSRNETKGIPIGPATSNIACEIILSRIDEVLRTEGYTFYRYIDDYKCFVETELQAENFILLLNEQLEKYRLKLNPKKTMIVSLPQPASSDWIVSLGMELPESNTLTYRQVSTFLDFALDLFKKQPDGSILKYAVKTIIPRMSSSAKPDVLRYILNLSFHFPVLIPLLDGLLNDVSRQIDYTFRNELNTLLTEHLRQKRSDATSWLIYFMISLRETIAAPMIDAIIQSRDALALPTLLLDPFDTYTPQLITFSNNLNSTYVYERDNYWLLNYELYKKDLVTNGGDTAFEVLKNHNIGFICPPNEIYDPIIEEFEDLTVQNIGEET